MADWYCKISGETSGPFSLSELKFLLSRAKLSRRDEVREGTTGPWVAAGSVERLAAAIAPSASGRRPLPGIASDRAAPRPSPPHEPQQPTETTPPEDPVPTNGPAPTDPPGSAAANLPPPVPAGRRRTEIRNRVLIGSAIGAGVVLLILLALLLFGVSGLGGGGRGSVAGSGWGNGTGDGVGDGEGPGSGNDSSQDGPGQGDVGEGSSADEEITEEVVEEAVDEGEESEAPPQAESAGEEPPEDDPPPQAAFTVERLSSGRPDPPQSGRRGGGGGSGMGDFDERLDREGAKSGDVQISLLWNNLNDLDLHVRCPSGDEIFYRYVRSRCGGELDVDMNAGGRMSNKPVENVYWPPGGAPTGKFVVMVNHFKNNGQRDPTKFRVAVKVDGQTRSFSGSITFGQPKKTVHTFTRR